MSHIRDTTQVVLEMIELRESDTARAMLRQTQVFQHMKLEDPERYMRLEHLCSRMYFDAREVYQVRVCVCVCVSGWCFACKWFKSNRPELQACPWGKNTYLIEKVHLFNKLLLSASWPQQHAALLCLCRPVPGMRGLLVKQSILCLPEHTEKQQGNSGEQQGPNPIADPHGTHA